MKKYLYLLSILLLLSCKDEEFITRDFPIIKTLPPAYINKEGATFRGEVLKNGKSQITSYGFVWSTNDPNIHHPNKVTVGNNVTEGEFETRIDHSLSKGVNYKIRAFATFQNKTVYGNVISLTAEGSKSAWSLELISNQVQGWFNSYGSSNGEKGYILFQSSDFYTFDPVKAQISTAPKLPFAGNSGTKFTSVSVNQDQYFFNSEDKNLYKFNNNTWSVQSQVPFRYGDFSGFYLGHSYSNKAYILSSFRSYMYDPASDFWYSRSKLPINNGYSIGGTSLGSKAYIITNDKSIWEYNSDNDHWTFLTTYPGQLKERILSYSYHDKIYFGLSYHSHDVPDNWLDKELWSYNTIINKWEAEESFPKELGAGDLFTFVVKGKLYFGHRNRNEGYSLWLYDPSQD